MPQTRAFPLFRLANCFGPVLGRFQAEISIRILIANLLEQNSLASALFWRPLERRLEAANLRQRRLGAASRPPEVVLAVGLAEDEEDEPGEAHDCAGEEPEGRPLVALERVLDELAGEQRREEARSVSYRIGEREDGARELCLVAIGLIGSIAGSVRARRVPRNSPGDRSPGTIISPAFAHALKTTAENMSSIIISWFAPHIGTPMKHASWPKVAVSRAFPGEGRVFGLRQLFHAINHASLCAFALASAFTWSRNRNRNRKRN